MKSLRKRLFGLTRPKGEMLPASFYAKQGFSAADAREIMGEWMDLELGEEDSEASYAALLHAWSILAYLGGKEGAEFLIDELGVACSIGDDDYLDYFPELMSAAGSEAAPLLLARFESGRDDEDVLLEMSHALVDLAQNDIGKEATLKAFVAALQGDPGHRTLKAVIILELMEMTGDTYLAEIRQAFEENLVNVLMAGDFESVEIGLGLRSERSEAEPHWGQREAELAKASQLERIGERPEKDDVAGTIRYLLDLHRGPRTPRSLAEFDGFILGSVLATEPVETEHLLSSIWDPESHSHEPLWDDNGDEELFETAVMKYCDGILRALDEQNYFPPLTPRSMPRVPTEEEIEWAGGLLGSVFNWGGSEADPSEGHQALLAGALHLAQPTDDVSDDELIQVEHLVHAAQILRGEILSGDLSSGSFGAFHEPYQNEEPKIGRNDPCPCGSGKKFKRCCMN
ncbi:SEC-C metal-binding domain-containing protein [Haloferula chungangensis]|uniref:SEC-C metal-binding domain-containing protein n=1 Tax=Haloferula chungangensis TaxID=1048331 RepID=A0ABW2L710_9BACT